MILRYAINDVHPRKCFRGSCWDYSLAFSPLGLQRNWMPPMELRNYIGLRAIYTAESQ